MVYFKGLLHTPMGYMLVISVFQAQIGMGLFLPEYDSGL